MARKRRDTFMAARRRGGNGLHFLLRKALLWSLVPLITLLLLALLGYAQFLSWLQGESFRDTLEKALANQAQAASADIEGTLGIEANRVSLPGLSLTRAGFLRELAGRGIHAELNRAALMDKELHLTRLMVEEGRCTFDADRASEPLPPIRPAASGFLSRLAPTSARLERFDCKDFNTSLLLSGARCTLADSSLSANPLPRMGKGAWEFRLNGGRLLTPLPLIGECNLKGATLTRSRKALSVSDARLMLSPGELIINAVYENASGDWSADIRANSVDISRLIGQDWKKRLSGDLYGRLHADGHAASLRQAEGKLSLQHGVLEALPFLGNLPVGNTYPYRSLKLEKATARLSYPHKDAARNIRHAWLLDQIDLRAEGGWLRVQGHALVDADGTLAGTLLIGLPEAVAHVLAPADSALCRSVFNAEGEKGYRWLRLNLSGSLDAPQEDLSARLHTLALSALPEAAATFRQLLQPAQGTTAPEAPEAPTSTPGKLIEGAGKAASELIGTGLRSLF